MKRLIGSAWPYANGSLHIGHIAALLPADVLARYFRSQGEEVYFVSGSDCHGTPVAVRARQEKKTPEEISLQYHLEFVDCFSKLGFSYDAYGSTTEKVHCDFVMEFHKKLYESSYIYEKETLEAYCQKCNTFLSDRFVEGSCPHCHSHARGDQCDACGAILEPVQLKAPKCQVCGEEPIFKETKHLFLALSQLQEQIEKWVEVHPNWRKNAISFTKRYLEEGLRDRAITRDLDWGIQVPKEGYENKKIYIWAENVLGYFSMAEEVAKKRGQNPDVLYGEEVTHYYVHGKDNIPFHTVILPGLLLAQGDNWHLPDEIVSSEYLTLEGKKISTSRNYAVWVKDILKNHHPDSIRYFLLINGPEKRDSDFSFQEFYHRHHGELLGTYGNFVNRTLAMVQKSFGGKVPRGQLEQETKEEIRACYEKVGSLLEKSQWKAALEEVFEKIRKMNKYFDEQKPWNALKENAVVCENTLFHCVQWIINFAVLLEPFLPFSSAKVRSWFQVDFLWKPKWIPEGTLLPEHSLLFERWEPTLLEEEKKAFQERQKENDL